MRSRSRQLASRWQCFSVQSGSRLTNVIIIQYHNYVIRLFADTRRQQSGTSTIAKVTDVIDTSSNRKVMPTILSSSPASVRRNSIKIAAALPLHSGIYENMFFDWLSLSRARALAPADPAEDVISAWHVALAAWARRFPSLAREPTSFRFSVLSDYGQSITWRENSLLLTRTSAERNAINVTSLAREAEEPGREARRETPKKKWLSLAEQVRSWFLENYSIDMKLVHYRASDEYNCIIFPSK